MRTKLRPAVAKRTESQRHPHADAHSIERRRLAQCTPHDLDWKKWGPYLSERQWGTVREDYSANGDAWDYFPHDHARSRAYRWGEDGLAGFCDHEQRLCLSLALWNGRDPILKERLFGLTNAEGNHGEDVKELYYYLDATPTHSYLKMLYKYPQREFPYARARRGEPPPRPRASRSSSCSTPASSTTTATSTCSSSTRKAGAGRHADARHGAQPRPGRRDAARAAAALVSQHLVVEADGDAKPTLDADGDGTIDAHAPDARRLSTSMCDGAAAAAVQRQRNERRARCSASTTRRAISRTPSTSTSSTASSDAVNPAQTRHEGRGALSPRRSRRRRSVESALRLTQRADCHAVRRLRRDLRDARRARRTSSTPSLQHDIADADARLVQRQAFAGMIWSKQFYLLRRAASGCRATRRSRRRRAERQHGRNCDWAHLNNADIISMPDKWEYPWYAAWDLAFHCIPLALIDPEFAKEQLVLLTREWYMHPNGQLPAYEWAFGDVNPPVHAWATWRVFQIDRKQRGDDGDLAVPRARVPQADAELHLVGESQGRRRAATSSRAASSGSTTSASSTAARRCRPAATSTRPTARAGWRCTAST